MGLGDLRAKFESFGWLCYEMDGNDMDAVVAGLEKAKTMTGQGKTCLRYSHENHHGQGNRLLWKLDMNGMVYPE